MNHSQSNRASDRPVELPRLPARPPTAHKGEMGRVAIVAGSREMTGAACRAARGALRGGAGLVRVFTPQSAFPIVAAAEMCAMTTPVDEDSLGRIDASATDQLLAQLRWADVVALGPGLGQSDGLTKLVLELVARVERPLVLDADGLNAIVGENEWWSRRSAPMIVTPHPGEMARLRAGAGEVSTHGSDQQARLLAAAGFAGLTGVVVVLKGHRTVVCDSDSSFVNTTGNAGMATGGMGDVLTGLIAALVGQGLEPFEAACLAVHCHGAAGDLLAERVGPVGYLASEAADAIPATLALQIDSSTPRDLSPRD